MGNKNEGEIPKTEKGSSYRCSVCGLVVTVDELCSCADVCDLVCCGAPMEMEAPSKRPSHFARVAELEEKKKGEEVKITGEMEAVIAKAGDWAIASATEEGIPNVVPIGYAKVLSKNQLMFVDLFLNKTRTNLLTNPNIAVSVWDSETNKGYQFKGKARFETSGAIFDEAVAMVKQKGGKAEPRAAVIIDLESIYVTTPGPDAGKKVSGVPAW